MTRRTAAKKNQQQQPLKSILKPSAAENTTENEEETPTDAMDADVTDTVITKALLKELFEKNYKKIVNEFNKTIESLKSQLDEVESRATNAEKKIKLLETENQKLKEALNSTSNTANTNANAINALEERIEDRTNRQLRKTMVFRGVPEENDNETWDDTKSLLAAEIAKVLNYEESEAVEMLERVHRAAPNPHYKGSAPRPIFSAFNYWRTQWKLLTSSENKTLIVTMTTKLLLITNTALSQPRGDLWPCWSEKNLKITMRL